MVVAPGFFLSFLVLFAILHCKFDSSLLRMSLCRVCSSLPTAPRCRLPLPYYTRQGRLEKKPQNLKAKGKIERAAEMRPFLRSSCPRPCVSRENWRARLQRDFVTWL